ncbi:class I SAM-dependent methyltransferase [Solidesulfovibrio carbinolicus]|uniref:Methyltransferase n=1 Tax=Solidesulfovibrio carbinolicus TaxID=296842 RepID=A0A4P6HTX1_9BACT|nr:class I SAM-dependent methyltransferase [Solidesulfovibrio carbinolicus]QAZ69640.1 hypothetical protein C3Y92_20425 [Solidesulfovibrio carbinolicus]
MTVACRLCRSDRAAPLLDFGPQPNSMRLLARADEPFQTHPLVLWACAACGFVFIADPMPADAFYTSVQQPTLTSPPPHLDELVREIAAAWPTTARILDIGANNGRLLASLRQAGFGALHGVEPSDMRLAARELGLDVAGGYFTNAWARDFIAARGHPDLVVCRHVIEHVQDLDDFVAGLAALLARGAALILETPDLEATAERGDCSVIWEQHVNYFDLPTLGRLLGRHGLAVADARRIAFGGGSLLCRIAAGDAPPPALPVSRTALAANVLYSAAAIGELAAGLRAKGKRLAGFGAGERGAMVINLAGLGGLLDYVVDDSPHKAGRFLPGSRLPILPSETLRRQPADYCLLFPMNGKAVETAIMGRFAGLTENGTAFIELFPASGGVLAVHEPGAGA